MSDGWNCVRRASVYCHITPTPEVRVSLESLMFDVRYACRGIRRSPLFAASVAATIGLGLGVLCSAFAILNAYFLRPIDLPDAHALYELGWDSATVTRRRFTLSDFDELRASAQHFSGLVAVQQVTVMHDEASVRGALVTGNYFQVLGKEAAMGRMLTAADARVPGDAPVVVLSDAAWRTRYGADPAIVGKQIRLGRQQFEVVGVAPPGFGLTSDFVVNFWVPLTMARAFSGVDPWADRQAATLSVVGRLRQDASNTQARAWFDVWLRQRFSAGSEEAPTAVRFESRGTRLVLNPITLTLLALIISAFSLVLLVACANVTNLLLARALRRQREMAVRLSLGASPWRVARQLTIESLVLAVPAAAVGLGLTMVTARVFPALILSTFPKGLVPVETLMLPLDPNVRVMAVLCAAAVGAAVLVTLAPAFRVTRANLVQASKGEAALDVGRSRLRSGLVAIQIGACVLFLVGATGLIEESRRLANPDPGISYERVTAVEVSAGIRAAVVARLRSDPSLEHVAAAWQSPLTGSLESIGVIASETRVEQTAGFMAVSPEYFPLFDIRVVRGRTFTSAEADADAPLVLVSEATARLLWPGLDPIGQTLDLVPARRGFIRRRPAHTNVRVIGVTEDVATGTPMEGVDPTCIYFVTGFGSPAAQSILVRGRGDTASVRAAVTAAVNSVEPDASFQAVPLTAMVGMMVWSFQAFSAAASLLGAVGLLLAFSGTYAVVAFLVSQRTREFGIRMALGATVRQIVSGMLGETLTIAAIGVTIGLAIAFALARLFSGTIFIVPDFSLRTYAVGTAIVLTATIVAALLPSRRAARIDPSAALRVD